MSAKPNLLSRQLQELLAACPLPLPAMSNCAAFIWDNMDRLNWAGFYLLRQDQLILGPFQGKPACTVIPMGKGVCGTAAASRTVQLVKDVHAFPGHIACDSASNSEIVLPLIKDGQLLGVMDLDSPEFGRFTEEEQVLLQNFCDILTQQVDWSHGLL